MTAPAITATAGGLHHATCAGGCSRPLSWTVATHEHAVNVLRKHQREHHPGEPESVDPAPEGLAPDAVPAAVQQVNLTAAARAVLDLDHAAATAVWAALTDTSPSQAMTTATALAESETVVTAHVTPF